MIEKLNKEGFYKISDDESLNGRKIEFISDTTGDIFGGVSKPIKGRLVWSNADKKLMAMKPRNTRRGIWVDSYNKIYVKLLPE